MKELPITLLISPLGFSTLATRMFSSFEEAFIAEAGILAVILVGLSSLLTWTLVIRKSDHL
jgi:iron(III) transport system permease protein